MSIRLSALGEDVLQCRSMGHAWEHDTDFGHMYRAGSNGAPTQRMTSFQRREQCMRCDTVRIKRIELGAVITAKTTSIRYPDGYLIKGRGRVTRGEALGAQYGREVWL